MSRQSFFDDLAQGWDADRVPGEDDQLARVVALADVREGQTILDVGTGTGVLVPHLLRSLGKSGRIVAVDISPEMLRQAEAKALSDRVTFRRADVHDLPFSDCAFDRVICNAAFPHFDDRQLSLREMHRVLRPAGYLVISHPIGRAAVNELHSRAGEPVEGDRVPDAPAIRLLLEEAHFTDVMVIDEPEFYLARGRKQERTGRQCDSSEGSLAV